jgi:hypothetical protein
VRELTCASLLNMRKGNFGMAAGCEQNVLGGEQNSSSTTKHYPTKKIAYENS